MAEPLAADAADAGAADTRLYTFILAASHMAVGIAQRTLGISFPNCPQPHSGLVFRLVREWVSWRVN